MKHTLIGSGNATLKRPLCFVQGLHIISFTVGQTHLFYFIPLNYVRWIEIPFTGPDSELPGKRKIHNQGNDWQ